MENMLRPWMLANLRDGLKVCVRARCDRVTLGEEVRRVPHCRGRLPSLGADSTKSSRTRTRSRFTLSRRVRTALTHGEPGINDKHDPLHTLENALPLKANAWLVVSTSDPDKCDDRSNVRVDAPCATTESKVICCQLAASNRVVFVRRDMVQFFKGSKRVPWYASRRVSLGCRLHRVCGICRWCALP